MESKSYAALDLETLAALDPNTSYAKIREMVGSGKRVLDVGCGPGNLATILSRTGNVIVGIDKDDAGLASAQRACERTIAADLDSVKLDELVGDDRFDVVVFADVLEHLRDPVKLLSSSRRVLRDGGNVIVSIPNIAHGAVRLALLHGRFEYQRLGILDDTHLRFYTRESVLRLLSEGGYAAVRLERTTAPVFERSDLVPLVRRDDYDAGVVAEILRDEDAETLQFVVRAAPVAEAQIAAVLTAEITGLQQAVRLLRAQLVQANDATLAARAEAASHTNGANAAQPAAERLAEVEGHYQHALELADVRRAERDEAVAGAERAAAALNELRRDAAERERELSAASERATTELESYRAKLAQRDAALATSAAELAQRDAALASSAADLAQRDAAIASAAAQLAEREAALAASAAALRDAQGSYEIAVRALEPLRAELARVQSLADALAAERDALLGRTAADEEVARATAFAAQSNDELRAARALLAEVERELAAAREETAAICADRDGTALENAAALQEATAAGRALQRRAADLESLLAVERTSREHVEEASDRLFAVARERDARAAESELRRLLASSAIVDMQLKFAAATRRRVPVPPVPAPSTISPALVLRAATVGRRTVTILPPEPPGRRAWLRARWRRVRRLLAIGSST
jgi:2-polyprenyl-3-methyl-5-hydroxy-6-metoxy-1,4-benzoquinol methylase